MRRSAPGPPRRFSGRVSDAQRCIIEPPATRTEAGPPPFGIRAG